MKLEGITKVGGGAYLSRYDLRYRTPSGSEKIYEMFSRDGGIDGEERLRSPRVDAVMIIMTDRAHERLLVYAPVPCGEDGLVFRYRLEVGGRRGLVRELLVLREEFIQKSHGLNIGGGADGQE